MTRVFLIRHAEAEGNTYRRAHGHFDGNIISGRGFLQIEQLKERFIREDVSAVYSSDLSRAKTTAMAVSRPKGLDITTSKMLREVDMGVWEDEPWGDLYYKYPEMMRYFSLDPEKWKVDGGEEYGSVQSRMYSYIQDIADKHNGETIAVFSHGFAIRAFMCKVTGVRSHDILNIPYFDNTAVTFMVYDGGEFRVEYMGDNTHLKKETSTFANQIWWKSEESSVMENMRYMPLNESRDIKLIESFHNEGNARGNANKEFTAFIDEKQVGMIGISDRTEAVSGKEDLRLSNDLKAGWIIYMYMTPEYRGKYYGIQLIGQAVSEMRRQGKKKLMAGIPSGDGLLRFCQKHGFSVKEKCEGRYLIEKDITMPDEF